MAQREEIEQGLERLVQLEKKIQRATALLQSERSERETLARENMHFRKKLTQQDQVVRPLQEQVARLQKERDQIKAQMEKLLAQVDSLLEAGLEVS